MSAPINIQTWVEEVSPLSESNFEELLRRERIGNPKQSGVARGYLNEEYEKSRAQIFDKFLNE